MKSFQWIAKLSKDDISQIFECLGDGDAKRVKRKDREIVAKYFSQKWIGYGWWDSQLIGYCFIKHPNKRPETLTVVRSDYRNKGIATKLRNFAINAREFKGHIIYSAVKLDNPASFKSIIKSGFVVFDITKDRYVQLM